MDASASTCWRTQVFPWINCNKVVGNFVQQCEAGVCSPLFQCSPIQYFQHLSNACCLFVYPKCPSSCPSLDHLYVAGTIVFNSFPWVPYGAAVLKLWTEYCCICLCIVLLYVPVVLQGPPGKTGSRGQMGDSGPKVRD